MGKKQFIALADSLRGQKVPKPVLDALVRFCQEQNPAFNERRWRDYLAGKCGPSEGKR